MSEKSNVTCKPESGKVMPLVSFEKCEAKGPCIEVCPYDVFEMQKIKKEEFKQLSFLGKIKTRVHKMEKAYVVKPADCHACGLCVTACPEKAIKLIKFNE
jgi:NAD-dependent dihydropyrimidine dehydrogenase PreA subunit